MKLRYSSLFAVLFFVAACSPSIEEITSTLKAYLAGMGEESALLTNVEQTDKNIYTGQYSVAYNDFSLIVYPFTAIVKNNQVTQFFKETDDNKVLIVTPSQNEDNATELNYNMETKAQYDERIRKEEEEMRAAAQRASGSGLAQKGASWLLSGNNSIIQVISYKKAGQVTYSMCQTLYGNNIQVYTYKVLRANGYGGTETAAIDVVFKNGNIIGSEVTNGDSLESFFGIVSDYVKSLPDK